MYINNIMSIEEYLVVDSFKNKKGDDTTEFQECENRMIIKQYSGINTDIFEVKKIDGKKLKFSFFKINGINYVDINGEHIIDYKRFINIQQVSVVKEVDGIKVMNNMIGDIVIHNCDPEIFKKSLNVMQRHMKHKTNYLSDLVNLLLS